VFKEQVYLYKFKEMYTFIQRGHFKLIKSDNKDIQKMSISNKRIISCLTLIV